MIDGSETDNKNVCDQRKKEKEKENLQSKTRKVYGRVASGCRFRFKCTEVVRTHDGKFSPRKLYISL